MRPPARTRRRDGPLPELRCRVGTVELPNPVMTAAGTAGLGTELGAHLELSALGAVVVKSLSSAPWAGNPGPRLAPVAGGMLNSVGLQNPGVDAWLGDGLPALAAAGARVVVSVWGARAEDYREVTAAVAAARRAALPTAGPHAPADPATGPRGGDSAARALVAVEANISCPNLEDRSRMFAHSPAAAAAAVGAAVEGLGDSGLPVWAKLSPNVTDLVAVARAVVDAGAGGLTLVNTLMGLALDPATGRARLGGFGGGLSGPALHPVAVRAVYDCRAALPEVAIVGVGGVGSGLDAAELIAAGADAVQVGTASFADPRAPARVLAELRAWCRTNGVERVDQLRGRCHA